MESKGKNILYIVIAVLVGLVLLKFIWKIGAAILIAAVAFVVGYMIGKKNRDH